MLQKTIEMNRNAYQYFLSLEQQYKEICSPLFELGMKNFNYLRCFRDGSYLNLINGSGYLEKYFSTIRRAGDFFIEKLEDPNYTEKYFFLDADQDIYDPETKLVVDLLADHGVGKHLLVYKKGPDYVDAYCFGVRRDHPDYVNFFLTYFKYLDAFMDYFDLKAGELVDRSSVNNRARFEHEFNLSQQSVDDKLAQKAEAFLRNLRLEGFKSAVKKKEFHLTDREGECLYYLVQHKTAKEIGRILDLSPRTIESYIKNVKLKTGFLDKSQLFELFV